MDEAYWKVKDSAPQITRCEEMANHLKISDSGLRRGTYMLGGKPAAGAGAVTHGAVRFQ